jgi:hypothetical protein
MKRNFILFVFVILVVGCTNEKKDKPDRLPDTIKVGMTYEEVEKILGKPSSIERGVHEFDFKDAIDKISDTNELASIVSTPHTTSELSSFRIVVPTIKTIGQMLYVTWVYGNVSETKKYFILRRERIYGKIPVKRTKYIIDGEQVSNEFYNTFKYGEEYNMHTMVVIDSVTKLIRWDTVQTNHEVIFYHCIVFDAASGRVVTLDYYPFIINKL